MIRAPALRPRSRLRWTTTSAERSRRPRDEPVVAVVIPAYQAGRHIQAVLDGIPDFVHHVIVVDDASTDDTAPQVSASTDHRVLLIRHDSNQGVGGAVLTGYRAAVALSADVVVKMDADGQMNSAWMSSLIRPVIDGEADYAKGNRFVHVRQLRQMPAWRRIGNVGLSFLTKLASGYWDVFDPTNGYTAIHASLIPMLHPSAIDRRYFFESSMLIELGLLRAVVRDVCIPARYGDETSHLSKRRALVGFPPRLLAAFLRRMWIQHGVRDFGAFSVYLLVGSLLTCFGCLWGGWHWWRGLQTNLPAPVGTIMLAVLPIILGIQFLLQATVLDIHNVPVHPIHAPTRPDSRGEQPRLASRDPSVIRPESSRASPPFRRSIRLGERSLPR